MRIGAKEYLGDAVYVAFDGYNIVLTTENGVEATNTIFLEPQVIRDLQIFIERVRTEPIEPCRTTTTPPPAS